MDSRNGYRVAELLVSRSISDRDLEYRRAVAIVVNRVTLKCAPLARSHTTPAVFIIFAFYASGRSEVGLASVDYYVSLSPHTAYNDGISHFVVADNSVTESVTLAFVASFMAHEGVNVSGG